MIIIYIRKITEAFNDLKKSSPTITVRRFAVGAGGAAAVGVVTGSLIEHWACKKRRENHKGNSGKTTVTIDVHDLENIRIEKTE